MANSTRLYSYIFIYLILNIVYFSTCQFFSNIINVSHQISENITLITITQSEFLNDQFFKIFLNYYYELFNIRHYEIVINGNNVENAKRIIESSCIKNCEYNIHEWTDTFDDVKKMEIINHLKSTCLTEYTLIADDDEFIDISILKLMKDNSDADYFVGNFVDMISLNDKLISLRTNDNWQNLFVSSKQCHISEHFGCFTRKINMIKKNVKIGIGHHFIIDEHLYKGISNPITKVYHFKWMNGLIEKLEYRLLHFDPSTSPSWTKEMIKQYIHLIKYDGFNLELLKEGKIIE